MTGKNNYQAIYNKWKNTENGKSKTIEEMMSLINSDIETAMLVSFIYWDINDLNQYIDSDGISTDACNSVGGAINKGNPDLVPSHSEKRKNNTDKLYKRLK